MSQIESILELDDRDSGPFESLEKSIGYTTLLLVTIPILFSPFLFTLLKRSIYRLTLVWLGCLLLLFLTFRFRFSWILWLNHQVRQAVRL